MSEVKGKNKKKNIKTEDFLDKNDDKKIIIVVIISLFLVGGLIFGSKYLFKTEKENKDNGSVPQKIIEDDIEEEEKINTNEQNNEVEKEKSQKTSVVAEAKYYYISMVDNLGNTLMKKQKKNLDPADFELPDNPTKEGYRFEKFDVIWNANKTEVKITARFIKVWNVNIYDNSELLKTIVVDDNTIIPATEKGSLFKNNHTLIGIYNEPECSTEYNSTKITSDTNVYTRWLVNPTIINQAYNGLYPSVNEEDLIVNQSVYNINLSGKVKHATATQLSGWGFTEDTHLLPLFINAPTEENIVWESKTFNGTTELVSVDGTANEEYILGVNSSPTGAPHDLVVSYTSTDGKIFTFTYSFNITNLELLPEVGSEYNITYVLDNQSLITDVGNTNLNSYNYGTGLTLADATTSMLNYVFVGWYSDSSYTNKVNSISDSDYGDRTLYSRFEYLYTINYLGIENATNSNNNTYTNDLGQVTLLNPEKNGYIFKGWKLNDENGEEVTTITPQKAENYSVNGTITLQAMWEIIEYTLKFNLNYPVNTTNTEELITPEQIIVDVTDDPVDLPQIVTQASTEDLIDYSLSGWQIDTNSPTILEYTLDVADANEENEIELQGVWISENSQ